MRSFVVYCLYRCKLKLLLLVFGICFAVGLLLLNLPESSTVHPKFPPVVIRIDPRDRIQYQKTHPPKGSILGSEFDKILSQSEDPKIFFSTIDRAITDRQACAVEATASHNRDHLVHLLLLYDRNSVVDFESRTDHYLLRNLSQVHNIRIWNLKTTDIFVGSYFDGWFRHDLTWTVLRDKHLNDAIRFLLLWKYGGVYMDQDFLPLKAFDFATKNSVVEDGRDFLTTSYLSLTKNHTLLHLCLKDFEMNYNSYEKRDYGSVVLTRNVRNLCNVSSIDDLLTTSSIRCGVTIFPSKMFYPVNHREAEDIFDGGYAKDVMLRSKNSYALYLWSGMTSNLPNQFQSAFHQISYKGCKIMSAYLE